MNQKIDQNKFKLSLESIFKSVVSKNQISYFEFLIVAKQINLRFETTEELLQLKKLFEIKNNSLQKQFLIKILKLERQEIIHNYKYMIISLDQKIFLKCFPQNYDDQIKTIIKKLQILKTYLEEFYGKSIESWFKFFDFQNNGILKLYDLRWTLSIVLNSLFNDKQIRLIYKVLDKHIDGTIDIKGFSTMFEAVILRERLQQQFCLRKFQSKSRVQTEVQIQKPPLMPLITENQELKAFDFSKQRHSLNLKYYRPNNKQKILSNDRSKNNDQKNNIIMLSKINQIKFHNDIKITSHKKKLKTQVKEIHQQTLNNNNQQKQRKRRNTKTSELRKDFVYDIIISREKRLEQERFRNPYVTIKNSQILIKPIILKQ